MSRRISRPSGLRRWRGTVSSLALVGCGSAVLAAPATPEAITLAEISVVFRRATLTP